MGKYPFRTAIGFKEKDLAPIEKVASDIRKRDPTFRYKLERMVDKFKEKYENVLIIRSKTEKQAHARGLLFTKRYLPELNLLYWVKSSTGETSR